METKQKSRGKKTARKWFERLPDGYREQALDCLARYGHAGNASKRYLKLSDALDLSFYWEDTHQGEGYWYAIYEWCVEQEQQNCQLPELWVPPAE